MPDACVKYQKNFMRGALDFSCNDFLDFFQFAHKVNIGVQTAGCIYKEYLILFGFKRLNSVIGYGCGVGAIGAFYDRNI